MSPFWKHGLFYGSRNRWKGLAEHAYTIHAVMDTINGNWTILLFSPPGYINDRGARDLLEIADRYPNLPLAMNMVYHIIGPLSQVQGSWQILHQQVEALLAHGEDIFNPDSHDNLIFDDDLFTRSRTYFWVIDFLQTADKVIRFNIEAWIGYRDEALLPYSEVLKSHGKTDLLTEFNENISKCNEIQAQLENTRNLFKEQREQAMILRDGLFSASAVMESRASTRLGENVKLLTYVSIFYLPLAFCASLWSTTDTFGFHNLIYTMVGVGLLTYILVFNLNHIVKLGKKSYRQFKSKTIKHMQIDERDSWKEMGELFHKYKPRLSSSASKPSEWWVLVYQFLRLWGFITGTFRKTGRKAT